MLWVGFICHNAGHCNLVNKERCEAKTDEGNMVEKRKEGAQTERLLVDK